MSISLVDERDDLRYKMELVCFCGGNFITTRPVNNCLCSDLPMQVLIFLMTSSPL